MKFKVMLLLIVFLGLTGLTQAQDVPLTEDVLIPAGTFTMGKEGSENKTPHEVTLKAFYIDKTEVTNAQYHAYCLANDKPLPSFWEIDRFHSGPKYPNCPVIGVSHKQATDYAKWAGKRLPTEAEWEYAARGGLEGKKYHMGDKITPADANYNKTEHKAPTDVGSYPPNAYGVYDMIGNVREWVSDFYGEDYFANSPNENPQGPEDGRWRVIKGGGWHSGPGCQSVYGRNVLAASWSDFNVGFRCARDAD